MSKKSLSAAQQEVFDKYIGKLQALSASEAMAFRELVRAYSMLDGVSGLIALILLADIAKDVLTKVAKENN